MHFFLLNLLFLLPQETTQRYFFSFQKVKKNGDPNKSFFSRPGTSKLKISLKILSPSNKPFPNWKYSSNFGAINGCVKPDYLKIQKGDLTAFRQFFDDFYPSLCFFAAKILKDNAAACDFAQEAFIHFWENRSDVASLHAAKSYLFTIVKRKCFNSLRDNHHDPRIKPDQLDIPVHFRDFLVEDETHRLIWSAIRSLPPQGRKVIERTLEGKKIKEIAEELDVSVNTVKTLKKRAFKTLRNDLTGLSFHLFFCILPKKIKKNSPPHSPHF